MTNWLVTIKTNLKSFLELIQSALLLLKKIPISNQSYVFLIGGVTLGLLVGWYWSKRHRSRKNLGDRLLTDDGYVRIRFDAGIEKLEHREVAESIIGRRLESFEVVHHINGRRSDNRAKNLCVMDRLDHERYHKWYDWIYKEYGKYPRRETQLRKLRESFNGKLLLDYMRSKAS